MSTTRLTPLYKKVITFNLFSACFCMSGQLALNTALSYLFSNSIYVFSFFVGLYLMSMGLGAIIADKLPVTKDNVLSLIIINGLLALVLVNPGVFGLLYFNEETRMLLRTTGSSLHTLVFPIGLFATVLLGIVSGIELPLFSKLLEASDEDDTSVLTAVLTTDYLGAFVGSIMFSLLIYPFYGLMKGIVLSQLFLVVALLILALSSLKMVSKKINILLGVVTTYIVFSYIYIKDLLEYLVKITI